jgi:hypothetical protein
MEKSECLYSLAKVVAESRGLNLELDDTPLLAWTGDSIPTRFIRDGLYYTPTSTPLSARLLLVHEGHHYPSEEFSAPPVPWPMSDEAAGRFEEHVDKAIDEVVRARR